MWCAHSINYFIGKLGQVTKHKIGFFRDTAPDGSPRLLKTRRDLITVPSLQVV